MELIVDTINNLDKTPNTIKNYRSQYKTLHKALSEDDDDVCYLEDPNLIITYLNTLPSVSSKRLKASVVVTVLRELDMYDETIDVLSEYISGTLSNQDVPKKSLKLKVTLNELINKIETIENTQERLVLSLYTSYPPVRGDYFSVKTSNFDEDIDNFYDSETETIVFNKLIKVNIDEPVEIELKPEHAELIDTDQEYLFDTRRADTFTEFLRRTSKKHFGKTYGVQFYRTLYTSTELQPMIEMKEKANELAKKMNHSSGVQQEWYLKKFK